MSKKNNPLQAKLHILGKEAAQKLLTLEKAVGTGDEEKIAAAKQDYLGVVGQIRLIVENK